MNETPGHLTNLNDEQLAAVTNTEGPLLVLAGAGSGKTRVLTRRIAHLIQSGVHPRNIIAVTFTNKAASEMRERVIDLTGQAGARVWVSTFHSSCCRILRTDITHIGYTKRFAIYDDDDQRRIIKAIIKNRGYSPERADAKKIGRQIDHYKNQGYNPRRLEKELTSFKNTPLLLIWKEYESALKAADALDFNDLIGKTVELFEQHPATLKWWQDRFQYVLVDEYQDTNSQQYRLLKLLVANSRNLAVVGDDDQSIYGFRGADIGNILNFQKDFPEARVIRLEQNYRSTGNILAVANAVVKVNKNRLEKTLWTDAEQGETVALREYETPDHEADMVRRSIQSFTRRGFNHGEIAILYRTNASSRAFESAFNKTAIPYRIVGGRKFYERREIRDTLCYLRLVVNPADDAAFLRVVNVPTRGVGAKTLVLLREKAASDGKPLLSAAQEFKGGSKVGLRGLRRFCAIIEQLGDCTASHEPALLVHEVLKLSGYQEKLEIAASPDRLSPKNQTDVLDAQNRLENLKQLIHDAMTFEYSEGDSDTMGQLTAWLDRISLAGQADDIPDGGEVALMTVHNAKGLEYPVVFTVGLNEGLFPHARSLDNNVDEERRLAYVAFTRAQKKLIITRSKTALKMANRRVVRVVAQPSRFLYGLPLDSIDGKRPLSPPPQNTSTAPGRIFRRPATARAEEPFVLLDIESFEQLQHGVEVYHPRLGRGEIQRVQKTGTVFVDFGRRIIPLRGSELKLVKSQ